MRALLPSPTAADGHGGSGTSGKRQGGLNLRTAVTLLPASAARDWKSGASNLMDVNARPLNEWAVNTVFVQDWLGSNGKDYGPAVRRWEEITGHPAPCPTEDGRKGNRRLNPAFSEWMMGVEPGWVTDIVDSRNDALHVIGNGVVPLQAEAAFRFLMDDENWTDDMTEETATETVAKPRGKCTGCAFSYQLSRSRSGGFRGQLVIRKHNCRTGPGLCSGALNPPEGAGTRNISQHGEDLTAAYSPQEDPSCEQCERDPDYCSQAPHPEPEPTYGEFGDGQHADGCTEEQRFGPSVCSGCPQPNVVPISQFAGHSVVGFVSSEGAFDPEDVVGVAPGGHPIVAPVTVLEYGSAVTAPDPFTAPAAYTDPNASRYEQDDNPGTVTSVQFTAPAPASDIPESATTVSGQPDPDRDRWGRYLIFGKPHTRATTFAKLGANTKAIEAWNERNVIRGMTLRPDLLMLANGLEVKRDRNDLNSIAAQAKDAAGSKVAANIGTAYHAFSERLDAGLISLMDVPEQYRRRVGQYQDAIRRAGLGTRPEWIERATAVRADQVGAPLPVAGTLDRIFQLPDGSLVIGDLKTGSDLSYGEMEIEVQLALYAHGVNTHGLFDWNTKTWENRISSEQPTGVLRVRTDIAIVIHLPADGDGCTLYVADIERGWRDAQRLGPLQASLKEKKRFRTLMAADLAPRPATTQNVIDAVVAVGGPSPTWAEIPAHPVAAAMPQRVPVIEPPDSQWEHAKHLFSTAPDQARIAELYQYAMDSGLFHVDQLAVLVGLGKDRLNALRGA